MKVREDKTRNGGPYIRRSLRASQQSHTEPQRDASAGGEAPLRVAVTLDLPTAVTVIVLCLLHIYIVHRVYASISAYQMVRVCCSGLFWKPYLAKQRVSKPSDLDKLGLLCTGLAGCGVQFLLCLCSHPHQDRDGDSSQL